MSVEIVDVNNCKKNISVEVPSAEFDQELENIAREYARNVKLPGFRPGKIPLSVIKQRFSDDLLKSATQAIIERSWKAIVEEHKFQPLAEPEIKDVENKPGNPLKFTLSIEFMPKLEVTDYKGLAATSPSTEVSDSEVTNELETLREKHAQFAPAEGDEVQNGQYVTVSMDYKSEGETKSSHEDDFTIIVGQAHTDELFADKLLGAKIGETKTFEISYPEDHRRKRFAGKKVWYSATVKDAKEKQLAELNDDFAKDIGSESLEALRAKVRDDLVTQAKQNAEKTTRETLLDMIVKRQSIDVPDCLVQDELEAQAQRLASSLAYQGIDITKTGIDWKQMFEEERPRAENAVRKVLVLDAIARQEGIEVTSEEVDFELNKLLEGTNKSASAFRAQLEKENRIQGFERRLRQNKAFDFIYRNATISVG